MSADRAHTLGRQPVDVDRCKLRERSENVRRHFAALLAGALALGGCGAATTARPTARRLAAGPWGTISWTVGGAARVWGHVGASLPESFDSTTARVQFDDGVLAAGIDDDVCALIGLEAVCDHRDGERVIVATAEPSAVPRFRFAGNAVCLGSTGNWSCLMDSPGARPRLHALDLSWVPSDAVVSDIFPGHRPAVLAEDGRLVTRDADDRPMTIPVPATAELPIGLDPLLAAGCVILADRSLRCWDRWIGGDDTDTGTDGIQPAYDPGLEHVVVFSMHSFRGPRCALRDDGGVWCWGPTGCDAFERMRSWEARTHGDVDPGWPAPEGECVPLRYESVTHVVLPGRAVDLAAGTAHVCAALADGGVWCWGANFAGQLGDGTRQDSTEAVRVVGLPDE